MIHVEVVYACKPGTRDLFYKETLASGFIDTVRKEHGCLRYEFTFPVEQGRENDALLLERWEEPANWESHKQSPHVRDFQSIKAKYVTGTTAEMLHVKF